MRALLAANLRAHPRRLLMRSIILTMAALVIVAGCEQKTETQTTTNATGTVQTKTTTVTSTMPQVTVDTAATEAAKENLQAAGEKAKENLQVAGDKAKVMATDAAHATGTALEKA